MLLNIDFPIKTRTLKSNSWASSVSYASAKSGKKKVSASLRELNFGPRARYFYIPALSSRHDHITRFIWLCVSRGVFQEEPEMDYS